MLGTLQPKIGDPRVESKVRVIWGVRVPLPFFRCLVFRVGELMLDVHRCRRVTRLHGSSIVVKSKFRVNLPPRAFSASVRVVRTLPLSLRPPYYA
jgi:hypothetical protein